MIWVVYTVFEVYMHEWEDFHNNKKKTLVLGLLKDKWNFIKLQGSTFSKKVLPSPATKSSFVCFITDIVYIIWWHHNLLWPATGCHNPATTPTGVIIVEMLLVIFASYAQLRTMHSEFESEPFNSLVARLSLSLFNTHTHRIKLQCI